MEWHGLKILYFISAFLTVLAYSFLSKGWAGIGGGFLCLSVYWFGCAIDDSIANAVTRVDPIFDEQEAKRDEER